MAIYKNLGGDSGVRSYQIGEDKIIVTISTGSSYEYTYGSAGVRSIETMKSLAVSGQGLNGFINSYVKNKYSRKIR